ncbi:MAG: sialate O-acetylesterase [Planctomycetia bacterium]|nr:sialate O-acetylesterase [Planctomycetia bacterium]
MKLRFSTLLFSLATMLTTGVASADVKLPAIFTSHMVLQRDLANPIWGTAAPGEEVTVTIGDQKVATKAGDDGKWRVKLAPLGLGAPLTLTIQGKNQVVIDDVLVGEVWVCSGQSNMQWEVAQSTNAELEIATAKYPQIRFISVPQIGTQEPQSDFKGSWSVCSPETVGKFSAVGYFFGRQLHQQLGVPVGLIDDAWGGSACEAWINRDKLTKDGRFSELIAMWEEKEKGYDKAKADVAHAAAMEKFKVDLEAAKAAGKPLPRAPGHPGNQFTGNSRPGNIYNGVLLPTIGYGIKGAIWYQGESNAGRAYQYRDLFPFMIKNWRDEWAQGDFPFYWVQLADFLAVKPEPGESSWAELREAQTLTMDKLPKTGEAVIIDIGEADDIHPRNKLDVGNRLARWALAKDYGVKVNYQSPRYKSMEVADDGKVTVTFDHVGSGLTTVESKDVKGFALAGEDQKWYWAEAAISPTANNQVIVSSAKVKKPVAVRYAWADNPICNLNSKEDLPATPFRSDDWPGVTANAKK